VYWSDTKAAARQSLNYIKNKKKCGEKRFSIWRKESLHPATWRVALGSWEWIHQVAAAPRNVIRGSGITCHWIRPVAAPCNVAGGSGMTCHWIRPNVCHIRILHLVLISTTSPQSTCHSAPVPETLSKAGHPQQKKMTSCRFSRWQISAILDFMDPIMGCLKSPIT